MPNLRRFFHPWLLGSLSGLLSTALYFGSDDWPRDLRLWALVGVWGLYLFGVGNLMWALWRTSRRGLLIAAVVWLGILLVVSVNTLSLRPLGMAEVWAYRLTHPRALGLWLLGQANPLDSRSLHDWVDRVLNPYLWMWSVTALVGLIVTIGAAGLRQHPSKRTELLQINEPK